MLTIGVTEGNEIYVGDDCVIQVGTLHGREGITLSVWYRGTHTLHTVRLRETVHVSDEIAVAADNYSPRFHNVKLAFDAPRRIPIRRRVLLTPIERRAIEAKAKGKDCVESATTSR